MVEHQRVVIMKVQLGRYQMSSWRGMATPRIWNIAIGAEKPQHRHIITSSFRVSFVPFGICKSTANCRQAEIASLLNHAALDSSRW